MSDLEPLTVVSGLPHQCRVYMIEPLYEMGASQATTNPAPASNIHRPYSSQTRNGTGTSLTRSGLRSRFRLEMAVSSSAVEQAG